MAYHNDGFTSFGARVVIFSYILDVAAHVIVKFSHALDFFSYRTSSFYSYKRMTLASGCVRSRLAVLSLLQ
jgi:hypothetical protein